MIRVISHEGLAVADARPDGVRIDHLERSYNDVSKGITMMRLLSARKVVRRKSAEWLRKTGLQMTTTGTDEEKLLAEYRHRWRLLSDAHLDKAARQVPSVVCAAAGKDAGTYT